jgi:pimeloyl-ACP methyl ester carboxylesterase
MIVLVIPIFFILNSLFGNMGFNDTVNIVYSQAELTNRIDSNTTQTVNIKDIPLKKVHVGDIDIAYKMIGKGEPILLINGLGGDMNGWEASTLEELSSSNHTVIVFDNRGAGNTTMGTKPFSIQQFANDTAGLMDGLKIPRTDILGYSMGSFVAQQLTLTHPEKVNRLILHGASCGGKEGVSKP